MLDPGKDPTIFDIVADDVSRANACWPDRIYNLLISDLWNGEFDLQSLGWNEYKASQVLFDEPYDPDEPSPWVSKSVATEADRGRPGTFRPMSRDIALYMLLAVNEPLVSDVIDEAGKPKFRLLAEIEMRRFGDKTQEILGDIAITNDARSQFCDRHGLKRPKSDEQEPPQETQQIGSPAQNLQPNKGGRRPASQSQAQEVWKEFDRVTKPELLTFTRGEITNIARGIAEKTGYKRNTVEKLIRSAYRDLEEKRSSA